MPLRQFDDLTRAVQQWYSRGAMTLGFLLRTWLNGVPLVTQFRLPVIQAFDKSNFRTEEVELPNVIK